MTEIQKLVPAAPTKNDIIPVVRKREEIIEFERDEKAQRKILKESYEQDKSVIEKIFFKQYKEQELKLNPEGAHNFDQSNYHMSDDQLLQFMMHASVRYLKKNYNDCVVGVTPHFIIFFEYIKDENKKNVAVKSRGNIHVMEIKKLLHGINYEKVPFLQIRLISQYVNEEKRKLSATFTNPDYEVIQKFTRIVYRNVSLAYANLDDENVIQRPKLSFDPNLFMDKNKRNLKQRDSNFPSFDEFIEKKLSPSQRFQFTYAANCSHDWIPYNHAVVENFHAQVINSNGVFNAGYIPIKYQPGSERSLYEMIPVFRSLIYTHCIQGVVCDDVVQPDILKAVSYQLIKSSNLKFLHLSKVQASQGLTDLYNNISCNTKSCGVIYFDFSGNPNLKDEMLKLDLPKEEQIDSSSNEDTKSFFDIFKDYKSKVIYLSFNECNLKVVHLEKLFQAMKDYPSLGKLKYLHISRSQLFTKPRSLFNDYLATHQNLVSLDIGNLQKEIKSGSSSKDSKDSKSEVEVDIVNDIIKHLDHQPLERLYLYQNAISDNCYESLKYLIDTRPMLSVLDISDTGLNAEQVSRIISSMGSQLNSRMLTIKANNLRLSGSATLSLMKGFLNGQLDRWETIYLNSNGLRPSDLQLLIPLFQQMVNLRELSLSDNFDNEMQGIEYELCNLLRISGLRILRLGGPASQDRFLGNKIKPFIFSVALSYQLRSKVGGLAMKNREKAQKDFSEQAYQYISSKIDIKEEESEGWSKYLQKKFDHVMKPFLLEKNKEEAAESLKTDTGNIVWRQMFREMSDLTEKCRGIFNYESNPIRKKTIADYSMEILTEWTGSMEHDIFKDGKKKWIDIAANLAHLKYLDLKEVKIDLNVITALLKVDRELRGIEIDGCDIKTVGSVVDFVNTIEEQPNLIKIPFPKNDMKKLVKECTKTCKEAGIVVQKDMDDLQIRLMRTINKHRFILSDKSIDEDDIPEYPFETIPEIQKLLQEKRAQKGNLRSHSGICEDFNMQLPYIPMDNSFRGNLPDDYYLEDDEIINRMSVYEFEPCKADPSLYGKSIAIQKRYDEVDTILKDEDKEDEDKDKKEEEEDDTEAWNKTTQNIRENWDFFQAEKIETNLPPLQESSEDEIDDEADFTAPAFDAGKSSTKNAIFYQRQKKDISLETDSDSDDNLKKYNKNHSKLKGEVKLAKSSYNINLAKPESDVSEPPKFD